MFVRANVGKSVVNPARAGMIRVDATADERILGKPRASGDDPPSGAKDWVGTS